MTKTPKSSGTGKTITKEGERIAKVMARAGLCSRREAESWIADGRVFLNGTVLTTPAIVVNENDTIEIDGKPLPVKEPTRLWLHHKKRGLVTSNRDPQGRPTVFKALPETMPRVVSVGRLDINTEGLLLLTNDGGLARILELPKTGWLRRYRARVHGTPDIKALEKLGNGVEIDGVRYGSVEAKLDRQQGANAWLTVGIREGKNREVKKVLEHIGLTVTRLIRISFGPFQLGDLAAGAVDEVKPRVLRDQLGAKLVKEAGLELPPPIKDAQPAGKKPEAKRPAGKPRPMRAGQKPKQGSKHANRRRPV